MTIEETRNYLNRAEAILDKLPEGAYLIDVSLCSFVQVSGDFDFRAFAEGSGAKVESYKYGRNIHLNARLFGLEINRVVTPERPEFKRELQICKGQ